MLYRRNIGFIFLLLIYCISFLNGQDQKIFNYYNRTYLGEISFKNFEPEIFNEFAQPKYVVTFNGGQIDKVVGYFYNEEIKKFEDIFKLGELVESTYFDLDGSIIFTKKINRGNGRIASINTRLNNMPLIIETIEHFLYINDEISYDFQLKKEYPEKILKITGGGILHKDYYPQKIDFTVIFNNNKRSFSTIYKKNDEDQEKSVTTYFDEEKILQYYHKMYAEGELIAEIDDRQGLILKKEIDGDTIRTYNNYLSENLKLSRTETVEFIAESLKVSSLQSTGNITKRLETLNEQVIIWVASNNKKNISKHFIFKILLLDNIYSVVNEYYIHYQTKTFQVEEHE